MKTRPDGTPARVKGGRHKIEYWSSERVIKRALSGTSWSKYGGAKLNPHDEKEWTCQACGQVMPMGMPQYLIPFDELFGEFLKICSVCKHTKEERKITYYQLIEIVRIG